MRNGAEELRANSKLKSSEYALPVMGLMVLEGKSTGRRRSIGKTDCQARGVMYLQEGGLHSNLMKLPEVEDVGRAIRDAMSAIEAEALAEGDEEPECSDLDATSEEDEEDEA